MSGACSNASARFGSALAGLAAGAGFAVLFGLAFPPFGSDGAGGAIARGLDHAHSATTVGPLGLGFGWLVVVAAAPIVWIAATARRPGLAGLGVLLGAAPMWTLHHLWVWDVTVAGFVPMVLILAGYTALPVWLTALIRPPGPPQAHPSKLTDTGEVSSSRDASARPPARTTSITPGATSAADGEPSSGSTSSAAPPARWVVQSTWAAWLVAPLAYTAVDWARGEIWFDGYPWFLLGHPTLDAPVIGADMAGTVGQYGATLLCSLAAAALAAGVHGLLARRRNAPVSTAARPSRRVCLGLVAGPLILAGAWLVLDVLHLGAPAPHVAIAASPDHMPVGDADAGPDANNILIAVVQTNVPQSNKLVWTPQQKLADYQRFMQLTQIASLRGLFADEVNASLAGRGAIAHSSADAPLGSQTTAEVALRDMQRRGVIVWPETMFPEPSLAPDALAAWRAEERRAGREPGSTLAVAMAEDLLASQAASGVPMIVGMLGLQDVEFREINIDTPNGVTTERRMHPDRRHNSAALLARGGVAQRYDKVHLTPFGEVMPYISRIDWLERMLLAIGASGMTFDIDRGDARQPLVVTLGGQSESPTGTGEPNAHTRAVGAATPICFEMTNASVVHDLVFTDADERDAGVIVQLTNDGWFGDWTGGKAHHLMLARWRAVELATPVVRAANTGISAHIDAEGRVVSFLPADVDGVLVASVEPADGPARPAVFASPIIGAGSAAVVGVVAALGLTGIAKRRLTSQRPRPSRGNDAAEAPATQEEHPPEPGTPRARTSDQPRCASSDAALQSSNAAARQIDGAVDTEIDTPTRGDARAPHRRTNP